MRKSFLLGMLLLLASTGIVLAQAHDRSHEKAVKETITFDTNVRVGTQVLEAGEYRVTCDRETIVFAGHGKELKVPCKGDEMSAPSNHNEVHTEGPDNDHQVLTSLVLRGSNIHHVFD